MYIQIPHCVGQADHIICLTITQISIQTQLSHHFHGCQNHYTNTEFGETTDILRCQVYCNCDTDTEVSCSDTGSEVCHSLIMY